jgi:hypothetical protein
MNQNVSKINLILGTVRDILIGDTTPVESSAEVKELNSYIAGRVYRSWSYNPDVKVFPQVTMICTDGASNLNLPSGKYSLDIKIWESFDASYPQTTIENISTRIDFLLNKQEKKLNLSNSTLRCRQILRMDSINSTDVIDRLYTKTLYYNLICDDEILS